MKLVRIVLLTAVLAFVGVFAGCQGCQGISEECRKAYEANSEMYGYVGGLPPECISK